MLKCFKPIRVFQPTSIISNYEYGHPLGDVKEKRSPTSGIAACDIGYCPYSLSAVLSSKAPVLSCLPATSTYNFTISFVIKQIFFAQQYLHTAMSRQ